MTDTVALPPNPDNKCFGCGGANEAGMKLAFEQDNATRRIIGRFVLGGTYQGGGGMAHGGIIALLLDEVMGKVCRFREVRAVTAELTVEYLKPVKVDEEIVVEGFETAEPKGRNLFLAGEIRNGAGLMLARGRGRFVVVGERQQTLVDAVAEEFKSRQDSKSL
jgi:acyl-coenzyme A thioesterase PaaI-like protein